ncbi:hypothetical protein C2U70_27080 [Bradyrhizobium guangdongense]|nr:hypothetical protein C2U70_27080 [Bradyrhizobium guangdongense]
MTNPAPEICKIELQMHRDIKEMLIGSAAIILWGIVLSAWPPLGAFIGVLLTDARILIEGLF